MPNINLSILNQKATPSFFADTLANRPAPSFVGRVFISTDTYDLYRDTGSAWVLLSPSAAAGVTGTGVANQVAFWSGTTAITGENNLWWDSTNNHLGINTNTPGTALDIHHNQDTLLQLNQTTAGNSTQIALQQNGSSKWRFGNDGGTGSFFIEDSVGGLFPLLIKNTTGQTFIGNGSFAGSGILVVESPNSDSHLQIVGQNAPSLRINDFGVGGSNRIGIGISTATNNFIQGSAAGNMCVFNSSTTASPILFGIWNGTNTQEAARISASRNFLVGQTSDTGQTLQVTGSAAITGISSFSNTGAFVGFPGVTITQGSGTGIALSITKAGNNEGLYVNKTSGTGNAATIIGTLSATTLVKSGGTSAQILAADGSVITAGTGITISGGTISASATGGITGSGTANTIPLFNAGTNITNSIITQVSSNIRVGSTTQTSKLNIGGDLDVSGVLKNNGTQIINVGTNYVALGDGTGKLISSDILVNNTTFSIEIGSAFAPYNLTNYGSITGNTIVKSGGTSNQILAADGSVIVAGNGIAIGVTGGVNNIRSTITATSGTYTPTILYSTMPTNYPLFNYNLLYTRVGNVVNVTGQFVAADNSFSGYQYFAINLPIASTYTSPGDLSGVATNGDNYVGQAFGDFFSPGVLCAYFQVSYAAPSTPSGTTYYFNFSYIVQ